MTYFWLVNYNSGNMINHAYFRLVNYYNLFRCIYESLKNCEINWCSNIARTCDSWFCVGLGSCFFFKFFPASSTKARYCVTGKEVETWLFMLHNSPGGLDAARCMHLGYEFSNVFRSPRYFKTFGWCLWQQKPEKVWMSRAEVSEIQPCTTKGTNPTTAPSMSTL